MKWLVVGAVLAACSSSSSSSSPPAPVETGSAATRPKSPFETFDTTFPKVGDQAPDFTLTDSAGKQLKLSEATARGPVVLVWGSFT